jgi:hypothetical protein
VGDPNKIDKITRDMAWVSIYQERLDIAKAAIRAALQMGSDDIETFLCAACLETDLLKTKEYLGAALHCIEDSRDSDPLYFDVCYDQILLKAKCSGVI